MWHQWSSFYQILLQNRRRQFCHPTFSTPWKCGVFISQLYNVCPLLELWYRFGQLGTANIRHVLYLTTLRHNYLSSTRSLSSMCSNVAIIDFGRPSLRLHNLSATWSGTSSSMFRISLIQPFTSSCVFSSTCCLTLLNKFNKNQFTKNKKKWFFFSKIYI